MPRMLVIGAKLRSCLGQIDVRTPDDGLVYHATSSAGCLNQHRRLYRGDREVALLHCATIVWPTAWEVTGTAGSFTIKRNPWSIERRYAVKGGVWNGATIVGNLRDDSFTIETPRGMLASAYDLSYPCERQHLDIIDVRAELVCVLATIIVKVERSSEAALATAA